jgi:hypothetical protein
MSESSSNEPRATPSSSRKRYLIKWLSVAICILILLFPLHDYLLYQTPPKHIWLEIVLPLAILIWLLSQIIPRADS